jgi:FkbM family methyltransferase
VSGASLGVRDELTELRLSIKRCPRHRAPLNEWPIKAGSEVILAGDTEQFPQAAERLRTMGVNPVAGIVDDVAKASIVPLFSRSSFPKKLPSPVVFVGVPRKHQFSSTKAFGQNIRWFDATQVPKRASRLADEAIFKKHGEQLLETYSLLEDEESKETFRSIVASRYFNDNGYLRISKYREYMHPFAKVSAGDVVVDAGAYVGKVTRTFANACGSDGTVYSFEPDPDNHAELISRTRDLPQVVPVPSGIWSETKTLFFDNTSGTTAGHAISEAGQIAVPVTSMDEFFSHEGRRPPTVIKFDIEGAEAEGLAGGENIITEYKPRLMISAYHKPADLWELIFQIRAMRPDYKFYLGHHNFYHTETDIYAV